jgi:hypothetical protein
VGKLKVHLENYDSKLSLVKKLRLEIGNKIIYTPKRAFTLKDNISEYRVINNNDIKGINEIYKMISKDKIDLICKDRVEEVKFGRSIKNILKYSNLYNELNLIIFSYENKDKKNNKYYNSLPTSKEVVFM